MKKRILPLLMLFCFACFGGVRAEEVIVGEATTTSSYLPTYCYFNYSLTQQIYTADEIGTAGTISSVSFYCTSYNVNRTLNIYLVNTNKSAFGSNTDWIVVTGADLVFSGDVSFLANQWNTIVLNTPFEYDGIQNLALIVDDNTGSYVNSYPSFNAFSGSSQALRVYSDETDYNPMAPSSYSGTVMDLKNAIKLNFSTCLPPTGVHVVDLTYNSVTMTWDFDENDMDQHFLQTSVSFNPANLPWSYQWQAQTLTWDNLTPDTDYTFGLRRYCSADDQSDPVIMTIHTPPACPLVSDLSATPLNAWQVSVSWHGPESNTNTRAEYKLSTETEWTLWGDHIGGGGVLGCQPNSTYDLRVLQYCTNGYISDWDQISFTMPPEPMSIPFTESFDATSIPNRWTRYTGLLNDVLTGTATLTPYNGGWAFGASNGVFDNHARLNIWSNTIKHWLVTPQVTMENNCQLSFELALTKYSGTMQPIDPTLQADDRFVVLASTNNGMTWTILREWNNTGSPYVYNDILATGEDVAIDLTAYQGDYLTIAFYGESTVGSNGDNNLHIDNVSIDYIPACQKPTNFHASNIAPNSVMLSWDAPEGQSQWEVGYKTDDDPYYIYFTEPTVNPYQLNGLQPETHYTVKVRALCDGFNQTSSWSQEIDFTTLEACPVPTNVQITHVTPHGVTFTFEPGSPTQTLWQFNFTTTNEPPTFANGSTTYHGYTYPDSWGMFEPETHYYMWVGIRCEEDNNALYWGEPAEFTTPEACPVPTDVTITNVTAHGLTVSFTPGGDWQTSWERCVTTENVAPDYSCGSTTNPSHTFTWENHSNILAGTTYYFWMGIYCEEDDTYHWAESVEFTTPYACSTKVYAQDVEIEDVQPHEVFLDWSGSPATADQWQVCYSYYNMLPPESSMSENSVIVDEPYATIDGLFPDLEYHFWIRALCDVWNNTPEWGEWSDMITVQTEVSCFPPINVTVSDITSTTATISWDPNPSTSVPVQYYEVNIESDEWGDIFVDHAFQPYYELDLDGWVDEGEDLPCRVYVHAYCGQAEGLSAASETVGFILTDKEQLTVNDGTETNQFVPIYGYWCDKYSKSQFIIPAEDIEDMQFSEISWMTFYSENDYITWGNAKFQVYLMELPCETEFTSATLYDWDDMELVRSEGSLEIRDGQMVVDLEEPFFYTDGNLVIGFKQTVSGTYNTCSWYGVNQTGNTAIGGYENSKAIVYQQFLPKTSFVYAPTGNTVCRKPKDFTVGRVDATTIECGWTPGSDETLWEIAWGYEDFNPDDNTTWISHAYGPYNPCWISNFTPDMTYVFAVRAVCNQSQGVYSNWTCPVSFTLETCPTPTNVTITDITTTGATVNWEDIGNTWITLYRGDYEASYDFETNTLEGWTTEGDAAWTVGVGDYYSSPGSHSGSYNAKITHTTNGNETWLISPMMELTNADIAYLDFWYINRSWGGDIDELGVYYRIDNGEWHTLFVTTEAHETWTNQRVNLASLATNDNCQIGFKMTDNYGYGVGLDDIQISGYKYVRGYWAYAPAQSITFTNLNPNTTYTFSMVADCDGESSFGSDWMFFTTEDVTTLTQTVTLTAGSNWFSTYLEITLADLQAALVATGNTSITIASQNQSISYQNGRWRGTLNLDLSQMYKISVDNACEIVIEGTPVNPAERPVTIHNGTNWIAFPLSSSMSLNDAFYGFAINGDMVKSQGGTATYIRNRWNGTFTLEPGKGYIYTSSVAGDRTLVFPTSAK